MNQKEKTLYYANNQVKNHSIYLWGGQGEKVKKLTAYKIAAMENSGRNAERVMNEIYTRYQKKQITSKTKAFDCSGLVICALIYAGVLEKGYDATANQLLHKFPKVKRQDIIAGDVIYKTDDRDEAYHTGLYIGNGEVIEDKGRDYGVIISKIDSSWDAANRPEYK